MCCFHLTEATPYLKINILPIKLTIPFHRDVVLTCRGEGEDQEMEEHGEVQHDVEVRTTRWGNS